MTSVTTSASTTKWEARRSLLRGYPRLVRWTPSLGALFLAAGLVVWKVNEVATTDGALWLLRGVALVMCLGAVFVLDDASATVTASSPLPTRIKTGWRCLLLLAVVLFGVVSAALICALQVPLAVAVGGWTVEVFAFVVVTMASALVLQRRWGIDEPGQFAGLGVVVTYLGAFALSSRWPMLVGPGPEWSAAHARWLVVGLVATVIAAVQLRDPASRSIRMRRARA